MARLSLSNSVKFKRLVRRIALANPFVRGLLETLWETAHAKGDPVIGSPDDIEIASEWPGTPGAWFDVLRDGGWIDDLDGRWALHDYWDHAPNYVVRRCAAASGLTYAEFMQDVKTRNTNGIPSVNEKLPTPDQTRPDQTRPIPPSPQRGNDEPVGFAEFWKEYPKKVGKGAAKRSWKRAKLSAETRSLILAAVKGQKSSPQWLKDHGQFIPNPATWLNQERWLDEVPNVHATSNRRKVETAETLKRTTVTEEELAAGRARFLQLKNRVASSTEIGQ